MGPVWLHMLFSSFVPRLFLGSRCLFVQQVVCVTDAQWNKYEIALNTMGMFLLGGAAVVLKKVTLAMPLAIENVWWSWL